MANKSLRIKALAKDKKIRLEDIANQLGIGRITFQQGLARNSMNINRLAEIADILGVEIPDLFESSSKETNNVCPHCGKPIKVNLE